ncbi:MAG: Chromosome partition protein Smc [Syntrophorhabdus sp. PtaU1.Bin002]|nr:MAG: Chromosome partition protein Smc [Syntrophorhabdus sp. PtaU1.Bin002]
MRLHRLELFGFKSFLNRTVFQFNEGITSIVGPNGCGKSNIVDAVVWALGERGTKSLRVKDMGDVIFHGSNGKRPVNIAEVTIELTEGGNDVAVKRRIYRDGTNEYYLNGSLVRLKDVQDFFLGTGIGVNSYAIVEQGRIEFLIQMKPQERRVVIEETGGITRFEEKKRDAALRLEEVSSNLERVEDIYNEVTKSFAKAEAEWQRWQTYRDLTDKQAEIEKWILLEGFTKLRKRMGKITERRDEFDKELGRKEDEKNKLGQELLAKEDEFSLIDAATRKLEVDIKGREKDMESRLLEIEYVRGEIKRLENDLNGFLETKEGLEESIAVYEGDIVALKRTKMEREQALAEEEVQNKGLDETREALKERVEEYGQKIEAERIELFVAMSKITEIKNRISEIERQALERKKREEKRAEEQAKLTNRLGQLQSSRTRVEERLERARADKSAMLAEEGRAVKERQRINDLVQTEKNAIESLRSEKRGKEEFLRQMASIRGSKGEDIPDTKKLIDVIKADETREKALERFFFRELEYHVLKGTDTAAIADTVRKHAANYIFFPPKGMFSLNSEEVGLNVTWIESLEEGLRRIKSGEEGIFLNDSISIDSRGFILREKDAKKVDLKQFRERKRAEKALKDMEEKLSERSRVMKEAQENLNRCNAVYRDIKIGREEQEKAINSLERELLLIDAEVKNVQGRLNELDAEMDFLDETPTITVEALVEQKKSHETARVEREGRMTALKQELDKVKKDYEDATARARETAIRIERQKNGLKALGEDVERKVALIGTANDEKERIRAKAEQTVQAITQQTGKMRELEKAYETTKDATAKDIERYEGLKETAGNLHMERQALQEGIDAVQKEMERIRTRREGGERELAILLEKEGAITERLATAYGMENPEDFPVPSGRDFEAERETIVREISELGEVNFRAEKEYAELKERVVFLEQQKEDLRSAMDSLKKTIAKIDSLSKDIFLETFETVNTAFKRFTQMLFKGGQGYLAMNQDNGGVEMYVQPPGKRVVRMEQLSGGEKALISLGFLLSLMDTKPSPFSLMDEIDAPLDDANLMGLMDIIADISRKTQILFITHNRITMECSNTIYGITMEDEGISKVVSVKL